jgi:hypothetical protein
MVFGVLALLAGGLCTVVSVRALGKRYAPAVRAIRHGAHAEGVVSGIESRVAGSGGSARQVDRPVITFTDSKGIKVKYTETMTRLGSGKVGERLSVRYDPADPQRTATAATWADLRGQFVIGSCVVLAFAAVAVVGVLIIAGVF